MVSGAGQFPQGDAVPADNAHAAGGGVNGQVQHLLCGGIHYAEQICAPRLQRAGTQVLVMTRNGVVTTYKHLPSTKI